MAAEKFKALLRKTNIHYKVWRHVCIQDTQKGTYSQSPLVIAIGAHAMPPSVNPKLFALRQNIT